MSQASTLEQARDFLLLPADAPAADVLRAAQLRQAEYQTRLGDPRSPAHLRNGAKRKLGELGPMMIWIEAEVQLDEAAAAAADPKVGKNQLLHVAEKVAQKIASLPDGEEKVMIGCRLADIRDSRRPKVSEEPDPAVPAFLARAAELRAEIEGENVGKLALARLLADANKAMSRIRGQEDRDRAEAEIAKLEELAEKLFARQTVGIPPPPDHAKTVRECLAAAETALEREELEAVSSSLAQAAAYLPKLEGEAQREAMARHAALEQQSGQLRAAIATDMAARKSLADRASAAAEALDRADPVVAAAHLVAARTELPRLRIAALRGEAEAALGLLEARLKDVERAAREEAARQVRLVEQMAALQAHVAKAEGHAAQKLAAEVRAAAGQLSDEAARARLLAETEALGSKIEELLRPPPPKIEFTPATAARLSPRDLAAVTGFAPGPIRLVARPKFVVGRHSAEGASRADFSVPLAEKRVSRAHVTLSRQGEEILIQDGEDGKRSSNGSKLDDEVLATAPVPASFVRERVISLGGVFSLTARHLPTEAPGGPPLAAAGAAEGESRTVPINLVTGCMKFAVKTEAQLPAQALWIFTDVSVGAAPSCGISLPQSGLADTHARIHFWRDAFWVENLRSGNAVRIGDRTLTKGEAAPLLAGETLHLGQLSYDITLET